jgi:CheY-like chemotaxis protein
MNGQELTERIRNHDSNSDVPVIILTGTTCDTDLPPGFWRIGTRANAFLEKPISPDALLAEVRRQILLAARLEPLPPGRGFY